MNKFKVGDRVRYIPCKGLPSNAWQNVTITRITDEGYWGDDSNPEYRDGYFPFVNDDLELIVEPQPIPDRAMALIRRLADEGDAEAVAVLAEIEPVDPDLLEARNVVAQTHKEQGYLGNDRTDLDAGKLDKEYPMVVAIAAIKRGRELERGEA